MSLGTRQELERAIRVVAPSVQALAAQLIVVRRNPEPALDFSLAGAGRVEIIRASADTGRAEMLALGMRAARGDIVAVRDDTSVKDAQWLSGYVRASQLHEESARPLNARPESGSESPPAP